MTEYEILRTCERHENGGVTWENIDTVQARSANSAIRQAAERHGADVPRDQFVAVPARSWKPVTVKVETKTALKFS